MDMKQKLLSINLVVDNEFLDAYCSLCIDNKETVAQKFKTQRHHIVPKYYFNKNKLQIDNSFENLVNLQYRDHILAHYYLALCARELEFSAAMIYAINVIAGSKMTSECLKNKLEEFIKSLDHYQELYEASMIIKAKNLSQKLKGKKVSAEARKNMSEAKKGHKQSEESNRKRSETLLGRKKSWAGRKQTQEEIERRRLKLLGHSTSEETRRKISESNRGKQLSDGTKDKISKANKGKTAWNKGLEANNKNKKAMYLPLNLTIKYVEPNNVQEYLLAGWILGNPKVRKSKKYSTRDRKVRCIETNTNFNTIKEASEWCNGSVINCLTGRSKTAGGYHWEYIT